MRGIAPVLLGVLLVELLGFAWLAMWSAAGQPNTFFGGDHEAYRNGAIRLVESGSPYHPALHMGPIANRVENVPIGYLYPPVLAQLFLPLTNLPAPTVAAASSLAQLVLFAILMPLVYRRYAGGLSATALFAVWLVTAASFPIHMAAWGGNLSGWITIGIAVMLLGPRMRAGIAAAFLTLLKLTPAVLLIPALLAGRRSRTAAVGTLVAVVAASVALSPGAWADWVRVLPNILRFPPPEDHLHVAPAAVFAGFGAREVGALLGLGAALLAGVASAAMAWQGRWAASVAAATLALLLGPSSLWDHYLALTVPLVLAAWPLAGSWSRGFMASLVVAHAAHWVLTPPSTEVRAAYLLAVVLGSAAATISLKGERIPEAARETPARSASSELSPAPGL
jgi:hypothetical protein